MTQAIDVECTIAQTGQVRVQRIAFNGRWTPVEQGRQWRDEVGLHVLIMLHGQVHTLTLASETLIWQLQPPRRQAI